jgi:hypothetical protein
LYARGIDHPDYEEMSAAGFLHMKQFYEKHREETLGVGRLVDQVWYPLD